MLRVDPAPSPNFVHLPSRDELSGIKWFEQILRVVREGLEWKAAVLYRSARSTPPT